MKKENARIPILTFQRPLGCPPGVPGRAFHGQLLESSGEVTHCGRGRHVSEHVDGAAAAKKNGFIIIVFVFVFFGVAEGEAERKSRGRARPLFSDSAAVAAAGARGGKGPRGLAWSSSSSGGDGVLLGVVHFCFFEREKRRFSLLVLVVFRER